MARWQAASARDRRSAVRQRAPRHAFCSTTTAARSFASSAENLPRAGSHLKKQARKQQQATKDKDSANVWTRVMV